MGVQTPEKSAEQRAMERAVARRASIEKAFAKVSAAAADDADAKKQAQTSGEKTGEKPEQPVKKPERDRGDKGRFVSAKPATASDVEAGRPAEAAPQRTPLADDAPYREPPQRFDPAAKADWHGAPESVRAATTKAFEQYENGIRQYREAAENFQQVRHYHDLARRHGTELATVLDNYTGMENKLRGDLIGGLDLIVNNLNLRHPDGRRIGLVDVAAHILQTTPEQRRLTQAQNTAQAHDAKIGQLHQVVQSLATNLHQMQYHQRFTAVRSQIDQFADSHPGFDERSDLIKQELDHGYSVEVAYDRAMKLRPGNGSTHAAQTRNASAQTRPEGIDRSISGAPTNGSQNSLPARKKSGSNREALLNAVRRVRSGV